MSSAHHWHFSNQYVNAFVFFYFSIKFWDC